MKCRNLEIISTLFDILCSVFKIWWSNFSSSSIVTPRYLAVVVCGISELFTKSLTLGVGLLGLGGMIRILDFVGLIVNLFALNHLIKLNRSTFIFDFNESSLSLSITKHVSSANSRGVELTADGKSLM